MAAYSIGLLVVCLISTVFSSPLEVIESSVKFFKPHSQQFESRVISVEDADELGKFQNSYTVVDPANRKLLDDKVSYFSSTVAPKVTILPRVFTSEAPKEFKQFLSSPSTASFSVTQYPSKYSNSDSSIPSTKFLSTDKPTFSDFFSSSEYPEYLEPGHQITRRVLKVKGKGEDVHLDLDEYTPPNSVPFRTFVVASPVNNHDESEEIMNLNTRRQAPSIKELIRRLKPERNSEQQEPPFTPRDGNVRTKIKKEIGHPTEMSHIITSGINFIKDNYKSPEPEPVYLSEEAFIPKDQVQVTDIPVISHSDERPTGPVVVRKPVHSNGGNNILAEDFRPRKPVNYIVYSEESETKPEEDEAGNKFIESLKTNMESPSYFEKLKSNIYAILKHIQTNVPVREFDSLVPSNDYAPPIDSKKSIHKLIDYLDAADESDVELPKDAIDEASHVILKYMNYRKSMTEKRNLGDSSGNSYDFEEGDDEGEYQYVYYDEDGNEFLPEYVNLSYEKKVNSPSDEFTNAFLSRHTSQLSSMLSQILKKDREIKTTPAPIEYFEDYSTDIPQASEYTYPTENMNTVAYFLAKGESTSMESTTTTDEPSTSLHRQTTTMRDATTMRDTTTMFDTTSSEPPKNFEVNDHVPSLHYPVRDPGQASKKVTPVSPPNSVPGNLQGIINGVSAVSSENQALSNPLTNTPSALETIAGAGAVALMAYGLTYALPFAAPLVVRRADEGGKNKSPINNFVSWIQDRYRGKPAKQQRRKIKPQKRVRKPLPVRSGESSFEDFHHKIEEPEYSEGFIPIHNPYKESAEASYREDHQDDFYRSNERRHNLSPEAQATHFNTYEQSLESNPAVHTSNEPLLLKDGQLFSPNLFDFAFEGGEAFGDDPPNESKGFGEVTYEYDYSNTNIKSSEQLKSSSPVKSFSSEIKREHTPSRETRPIKKVRRPMRPRPQKPIKRRPNPPPKRPKQPQSDSKNYVAEFVGDFLGDFNGRVPNHIAGRRRPAPARNHPPKPLPKQRRQPMKTRPKPIYQRPAKSSGEYRPRKRPVQKPKRPVKQRRPGLRHRARPKSDEGEVIYTDKGSEGDKDFPTYVSLEQLNKLAEEEMEGIVKGYSDRYQVPWPPSEERSVIITGPELKEHHYDSYSHSNLNVNSNGPKKSGGISPDYSDFDYVDVRGSSSQVSEKQDTDFGGPSTEYAGTSVHFGPVILSESSEIGHSKSVERPYSKFQIASTTIIPGDFAGFHPGSEPQNQRRDKKSREIW